MIKKVLASLLLALAACGPGPVYPMCDYCKNPKQDARPYACRKCGNLHSSCTAEAPLHAIDFKWEKGGAAAGRSIKICPEGMAK